MKKISIILFIIVLLLQGCALKKAEDKAIHIAVMLEDEEERYVLGVNKAISDVQEEYKDYDIKCTFYKDFGNYDIGAGIIDEILSDNTITAILSSKNMDITKMAAHEFEKNKKLMIARYSLYDEVLADNSYKHVFSLCYSAEGIGKAARSVANFQNVKKWAVCYADDEFSRQEVRNFTSTLEDSVQIMDIVKENLLLQRFDSVLAKWQSLDIEGVAVFLYDITGIDLVKKIKEANPELCIIGDFEIDNDDYMTAISNWEVVFEGLNLLEQFHADIKDEEWDRLSKISGTEDHIDTNTIHGYNAVRMVVDTAVKNNTVSPTEIAKKLHEDGYMGISQEFAFTDNGRLKQKTYGFSTLKDGNWIQYSVDSN